MRGGLPWRWPNKGIQMTKCTLGKKFTPEKTSDQFWSIDFQYPEGKWEGALPIKLRYQGFELTDEQFMDRLDSYYESLKPSNRKAWFIKAKQTWEDQTTQTYKVFEALKSGRWECRVHGPVPQVNPQAASRIRDIKKRNFVIASERQYCEKCKQVTMHDVLVMLDLPKNVSNPELRKPISPRLRERIFSVLKHNECVFDQVRTSKELIVDHKFPSQRWGEPESDNSDHMSDNDIRKKFQLLSNQTNLLKSRECDRCVFESVRGQFMGIRWYFKGNNEWVEDPNSEEGCIGCPWHDVSLWKDKLRSVVEKARLK